MSLKSSCITSTTVELFQAVLSNTTGDVFAVDLSEEQCPALVDAVDSLSEPPTVRSLVTESVAKWLRNDFLVASAIADHIAAGSLSLRTTETPFENTLMVTEDSVVAIVSANDHVAGLVTGDDEFVSTAREKWGDEWDEAAEFSLRTPPRSAVHESLAEKIGDEVDADFRAMFDSIDTTRDKEALDEVGICLLAAAKNEIQLFEISKWGEDAGVASKATLSRTKTHLEERGLIDTEKIPMDVGRPRLRLLLDDELRGTDASDLVEEARKVMAAAPA